MKATHALSLYVHTNDPDDFKDVHKGFSELLEILSTADYPYAGMSSMLLDDEPVEEDCDHYFKDADTVEKVKRAIAFAVKDLPDPDMLEDKILAEIEQTGILLMERR
jgi:hypothetical protein